MSRIRFNEKNEEKILYIFFNNNRGATNRSDRERMKRILYRAINHELTPRQRDCLTMYYLEGMKMKDIADALHLSRSTVTRHIQAATRKLRRVASYYSS